MTEGLDLRRLTDQDLPAVRDLLAVSLGNRRPGDPVEEMFTWKHMANPFGRSPSWVATDADRVVAFRTFMRWRFVWDGAPVSAVRAVDTVTHPEYRGRGLFRALTLLALEELTAEGVGFVFNTPNDQSRPGYLSMGWREVGHLPISARPRGVAGLVRMTQARQPAELWSEPVEAGASCEDWLGRHKELPAYGDEGITTDLTPEYLRWRYGFGPLHYRVWSDGERSVVYRIRRRGPARELALLEMFGPGRPPVLSLLRSAGADYAVGLGASRPRPGVPLPGQGPLLTWRGLALTEMPPLDVWNLRLGDIELF